MRPQPLQIVFSLPCGRILPIPRNLCVTPLWDTQQVIVAYECARASTAGARAAGFSSHACALQFTNIHTVYIHPELLDRAQLTEQLSHIQSELAAGTQIHYNTKCAVYDLCREVQNKGCMCLPQLIIGMLYTLTHS